MSSIQFLNNLNLNENELEESVLQKLSEAPSDPVEGRVYYNTTDNKMYYYNGTEWIAISSSLSTQATSLTCTLPDDL